MSHLIGKDIYRGFVSGKCFDLELEITYTNFGVYDPGTIKEFTKQDEKGLRDILEKIVDTFQIRR